VDVPLDHNFPEPILRCLDEFIPDIRLLPLRQIHPMLPQLGDREVLIALHQLGYSGLITSNYKMLQNPRELAAVLKTKITVFAIEGVGHDPIRATGALLLDLPAAITAVNSGATGVFWLRPRHPQPQAPWDLFKRAATKRHEEPADLYDRVQVSDAELSARLL
jgi:hypothetical protein